MKAKTHEFKIKVHFDKKCTKAHALRELRDCIHGKFYTTQIEDNDPCEFKVKSFSHLRPQRSTFDGGPVSEALDFLNLNGNHESKEMS